jgi:transmembrane sensor
MKITKDEFQVLLDKYLNGTASAEESKLLDQFFDSYQVKPNDFTEINNEIKQEILENIQTRVRTTLKVERSSSIAIWWRAAAAIAFVAVASYLLFDRLEPQTVSAPMAIKMKQTVASKGQKVDIKLSDGTRIKLNANSKISYPENFSGNTREVTLDGEAYFMVVSDSTRPFLVHANDATTRVVGTSFNIRTNEETTAITLVEGKVNVSLTTGQVTALTPNEQAVIARGSQHIEKQRVDVERFISWKNNTLLFDHIKVSEAFAIMEDWYNVEIKVSDPAVLNCVITSKYENESLENVLNSFRFMLKMDFDINGNLITVSGEGCR